MRAKRSRNAFCEQPERSCYYAGYGQRLKNKNRGCRGLAPCSRQIFLRGFTKEQVLSVVIPAKALNPFLKQDWPSGKQDWPSVIPAKAGIQSLPRTPIQRSISE